MPLEWVSLIVRFLPAFLARADVDPGGPIESDALVGGAFAENVRSAGSPLTLLAFFEYITRSAHRCR